MGRCTELYRDTVHIGTFYFADGPHGRRTESADCGRSADKYADGRVYGVTLGALNDKVLLLYSTLESASMYGIRLGIHLGPLFSILISCEVRRIGVKRALIAVPIFCMCPPSVRTVRKIESTVHIGHRTDDTVQI